MQKTVIGKGGCGASRPLNHQPGRGRDDQILESLIEQSLVAGEINLSLGDLLCPVWQVTL